jgi:ankyrin repeat protein
MDPNGDSALTFAASSDNMDVLQYLLSHESLIDVDMKCGLGFTALDVATRADKLPAVQLLLDKGADPRSTDKDGACALFFARSAGAVRLLVKADPDAVSHRNNLGRTAIFPMTRYARSYDALVETIKNDSEFGVPVELNHADDNGDTALHIAMVSHNVKAVKSLLEKEVDVMGSGWQGTTALMKLFLDTRDDEVIATYDEVLATYDRVSDNPGDNVNDDNGGFVVNLNDDDVRMLVDARDNPGDENHVNDVLRAIPGINHIIQNVANNLLDDDPFVRRPSDKTANECLEYVLSYLARGNAVAEKRGREGDEEGEVIHSRRKHQRRN